MARKAGTPDAVPGKSAPRGKPIAPESRNKEQQFKPGQSGNPGGRPKGSKEFRDLCIQSTPEAFARMLDAMRQDGDMNLALRAAQLIIERAFGKAVQPIAGDGENPVQVEMNHRGIEALEEMLKARREKSGG